MFCYEYNGTTGKQFGCNWMSYLKYYGLTSINKRRAEDKTVFQRNGPIVMGFSDNHFDESFMSLGSAQKFHPNSTIIVYDLGLSEQNAKKLKSYCRVQYRKFAFERYPWYVGNLKEYRFKPLIIAVNLVSYKFC